jgi:hypothetical protein
MGEGMTQITTTTQPGDIVVIVPRWIIIAVGLLMLLMGLSVSFLFLFVGFITESLLFSLFVLVLVPLQLLILYIVWRYYWYFLMFGILLQSLLACTLLTGIVRIGGNTYSIIRSTSNAPVFPVGDRLALYVLLAFGLALLVVGILAFVINMVLSVSTPAAPVRKSRPVEDYPPLDDPSWDDPKPRRRRDLWQDDQ